MDPKTTAAFDDTARQIIEQYLASGCRGFATTAVNAGTGASFATAGLGIALARAGVQTLLVDCDVRNRGLASLFAGREDGRGLSDLLVDDSLGLQEVMGPQPGLDLFVLHAGPQYEGVEDLLDGHRFREVAEECLRGFACTIFDTPPANRSSEARRVSAVVGYALIVARRSHTFAEDVEHLSRSIREDGAIVLGSVLNGA